MIRLKLDENEREILLQLLENCISDLRVEITDTDNLDYKNMLKGRKVVMIKLLEALQSTKTNRVNS
jgi:ribonuclease HII